MAVVSKTIENQIINLIKNNKKTDSDEAIGEFASGLASIITEAIRSGDVIVPSGIPVTTAGTATSQTGVTTAPAKGSIK